MSTKIYDGYRYQKTDTDGLFSLFEKLRDEFSVVTQKLINNTANKFCVNIIDRLSIGINISDEEKNNYITKEKDDNIKNLCWFVFNEKINGAFSSTKRSVSFDFSIKCSVLKTDLDPDYLYFIFYYEQKEYREVIDKYFEHYPYWNNTDPPDEYSWEEWEEVGKIWDSCMKHLSVPSLNGFVMDFNAQYYLPNPKWEDVVKNFPSKEERANSLSKRIVQEILYFKKLEEEGIDDKNCSISESKEAAERRNKIIKTIMDVTEDIRNGKHNDKIETVKSNLMKLLPDIDENTDLSLDIYKTYFREGFNIKQLILA
jgi:hypothetical protein